MAKGVSAVDRLKAMVGMGRKAETAEDPNVHSAEVGGVMNSMRDRMRPMLVAATMALPAVACGDFNVSGGIGAAGGPAAARVDTNNNGRADTVGGGLVGAGGAGIQMTTENRTLTVGVGGAGGAGGSVGNATGVLTGGGAGFVIDHDSHRDDDNEGGQPTDPFHRN